MKESLSLFAIENEIRDLLENLNDENEDKNLTLVKLTDALKLKTDQVSHYRESLKNYSSLLDLKIEELEDKKAQVENKIDQFDEYVLNCMAISERDSFDGSFCSIKKRAPSKSVEIYDEKLIPIDYIKIPEVKPMIMKAEISKALKQGEIIEGARLVDGKVSLIFKTK